MIAAPLYTVSLDVNGKTIEGWSSYSIDVSMRSGAGAFHAQIPFDRQVWELVKEDSAAQIKINGVPILTGFIDERDLSVDDESITVIGRDWVGRLVQASAPGISFAGLDTGALLSKIAAPWFKAIVNSDARAKAVSLGRGHKVKPNNKPRRRHRTHRITRVEPGQTHWQIIEEICNQVGLLAWSSGDGRELIVDEPDYDQAVQFVFFKPRARSLRSQESTVIGMGQKRSTADRYSRIICLGSGAGTDANYGYSVGSRTGEARNNTASPDGTGIDFQFPKILVMQRDVASAQAARDEAEREMAKRDADGHVVTVKAHGHGQVLEGSSFPTLFTLNTLASVEDERIGLVGKYLITDINHSSDRPGGETSTMTLVRKGSELAP